MSQYNVATAPTETRVIPSPASRPATPALALQHRTMSAKGWSMEKWLCWGTMGVAGVFMILFMVDLIPDFPAPPFMALSSTFDIIGIVCCMLLFYLGLNALRDLRQ